MNGETEEVTDIQENEEAEAGEAHVYEERCFICNQQCYSKPMSPTSPPSHSMIKWALETRESVYDAFGIQVDPSFFQETQGELPICPLCSFTVGRMKVVQKQLQDLQSLYDKIRAEIAFSIVDVVASTGGSKNHLINLGDKSPTSLLNSFRECEAECLQQLIFESWHDRNTKDGDDFKDNLKKKKNGNSTTTNTTTATTTTTTPAKAITNGNVDNEDEEENKERLKIVADEQPDKKHGKGVTITLSPQFCHEDEYSETEFINENCDDEMEYEDDFPNQLEITEWSGSSNVSNDNESNGLDEEFQYEDSSIDNVASPASGSIPISTRKTCGIRDSLEMQQNEEGLYVCMFCTKTFIHKYPYRDHLKTHTGEGPRCEICHKIFPKNHNLMLHMRTHTGEKPYVCEVCNKGFADKSNLKVHMRVHTGERPYKCEFCDQAFVNSSRLVVHRRLHTGEKPFRCDQCSRSFSTGSQLQAHQKMHYSGKPFSCDECGKPYSSATSLQSHKNLYHGI